MSLLGPDGKEIKPRQMPTRAEKFNMVWMMFTLMTSIERRELVKSLKPLRRKLDVYYPNGMDEGAIQNELKKAAESVIPDPANDAQPEATEIRPEPSVPVQPADHQESQESAPASDGGI